MTEQPKESAADRAIREALESVERIERESRPAAAHVDAIAPKRVEATDEEADQVRIVSDADDAEHTPTDSHPPSSPVARGASPSGPSQSLRSEGHSTSDGPAQAAPAQAAPAQQKKSAADMLLEATIKAKQEMHDVLVQTQKEAKDMFDRLARVSADFDNYKKRVTREKQDAIKFANEALVKELLPVLDNMHRALATGEQSGLLEGVKLVAKQFDDAMSKIGVVGFSSQGQLFDPARHEAVGSRPEADVPANHVAEEYQRGYMLHDRLLRPALVIVSSGPPATEN